MNMDDLLDLNFGSSKPAQQTNQSAGRPAHAPVTATPIGKSANNDPFSAFVPFSDKQTKTLAQQQQERQQQQAARPPAAGTRSPDFFNSLAQNAGQPSYSSNTSTSRPAAATQIQQSRPVNPQPSSSSNGDPFSNLVSNSIPKAKPMGAMGSAASANVNTSKAAPANDWDFALFEAPKTVPAPIHSNVQPSDTLDIFSSPVTSTKPASVPASSSASSKSSSFDVFDDFASFAPPTSSTNSTASPAASSSDIDFAIFDKPKPAPAPAPTPAPAAAPAPERQPVKQTPPPQPAPVLPPRPTETAAADEAPARRPQSDKHKDRFDNEDYGLIREEPRRKQDDDREDYGPIRDEPSTRRPRPQSTATTQSDVASNLLGSMFGALNTIKETATKTAATAVKFTAETTAQAKKFIDDKIREEEAKKVPPHLIKLLEEMGARPDDARVALQETKNDVQAAMKLLHISPPSGDHFDSSPAQSSAERLDIDGKIAQLADMGFSVQDAQRALQRTNGDFQAALNGLTNRKQSPAAQSNTASPSMRTTSPAARPALANAAPSPRPSSPAVVTKPPPQKKKLEAPPLDPQIEQQANALRLKGNELFKQGQYDDAKIIYSEALTLIPKGHPATLPLLGNRAQCSLSADSFKSCIEDCNAVLALVPDDVKSLLRRAKAYEATEKLDDSYNDYKMALELDPSQKAATQGMDRILKSKRQLEKHLENEASGNLPEYNSASPPPVAAAVPVAQPPPSGPQRSHADELADLFDPTSGSASAAASARPGGVPLEEQGEALKYHKKLEAEKQEEEAAKAMFEEEVEQKLSMWRSRKEGNIRALLSSLDSILWPDLGWQTVTLAELVTPNQVKARYMKAINKVHPDKVQSDNLEHKMLAQGIFYTLNQSWDIFKVQNGM